MNHKLKLILGTLFLFLALFVAWFIWGIFNDELPQFFPFDDLQATYTVSKKDNLFWVTYDSLSSKNKQFVCEWKKKCHTEINNHIEVLVGETNYDLNQYLNNKVSITRGGFKNGFTKQCVAKKCVDARGPYTGLNIEQMEKILEAKPRDKIIEYEVIKGDSLPEIAEKFGISTNTIKWANDINSETVKPGKILKILPVTGVMHTVEKGETIYTIAKRYQIDVKKIIDFPYNLFSDDKYTLTSGQTLMVPDATKN